jgi:MotA/TolQ/ExbB proton channel family
MQDSNRAAAAAVTPAPLLQQVVSDEEAVPRSGRPLFLRWLCVATASTLVLTALALGGFAEGVSGAPFAVALVILAATVAVAALAGILHWRADSVLERGTPAELEQLRHDAHLVFYAVALFQVLGMIGALLGYREQTRSASLPDSQAAVHALTTGLGNGLTATLVGVVCSVVVWVMFLHLQHALDKPR